MVSFFSENYYIYHYSNSCSLAYISMIILILFTILLPFFTSFSSLEKFWLPNTIFTDHPIVQFKDEFFIELTFNVQDFIHLNYMTIIVFYLLQISKYKIIVIKI